MTLEHQAATVAVINVEVKMGATTTQTVFNIVKDGGVPKPPYLSEWRHPLRLRAAKGVISSTSHARV